MHPLAKSALLFAGAITLALPDIAMGQTAGGPSDEIVVTARRIVERLQDVPISISVFNQKQLDERDVTNGTDLATYTPSLSVNQQFGTNESAFSLRGFYQAIGTSPTVGVYFADAVAPRGGIGGSTEHGGDGAPAGSFFDLQNVQVLKGPQGTLFGRNTTGGDILLVPKKPTGKFEGYVEASAGDYDMKRLQAVVNIPVSDKFRLRFGVDRQTREGYLNNVSGVGPSEFGNVDYIAARVSIVLNITDDIENYTVATFSRSQDNGEINQVAGCDTLPGGFAFFIGPLACAQIQRDSGHGRYAVDNIQSSPFGYSRQWQIINTTTWVASDDLVVKNIASYGEWEQNTRDTIFGANFVIGPTFTLAFPTGNLGPFPSGPFAGLHFSLADVNPFSNGAPYTAQDTITEELQFQGHAFDDKLQWTTGLYVESSQPLEATGSLSGSLLPCGNIYNPATCVDAVGILGTGGRATVGDISPSLGTLDWHDYGVYGQATYALTDYLKLTGGVRWTDDLEDGSEARFSYLFPAGLPQTEQCSDFPAVTLAQGCRLNYHASSRAPTWVMDVEYTPIEDVNTYVKYSRGYRAGGIAPIGAPGYTSYGPEQVDAYEVGAKTSFHGAVPGTLDVSGYYNNFTNQQILTGFLSTRGAPQSSAIINAGSSRIYGLEIDGSIMPYKGLTLAAGYSYINSLLTQLTPIQLPANALYNISDPLASQGSELPLTPRHKLTVSADYVLPLDPSIGKITLGANFTYTAKQLVAQTPVQAFQYIPSSSLLNLDVSWEKVYGSPIDAEFFMTNVADSVIETYVTDFAAALGFDSRSLAPPRMFGGRLRYRF